MDLTALMLALMAWASAHTGLPAAERPPVIEFRTAEQMHHMAGAAVGNEIGALYRPGVITLPEGWNVRDAGDVSTLLHELVHHLQDAGLSRLPRCAKEGMAYNAQYAWLAAAGYEDPVDAAGHDGMGYLAATMCPHWAR